MRLGMNEMDLDEFYRFYKVEKESFLNKLKKNAKKIRLKDILDELEATAPVENTSHDEREMIIHHNGRIYFRLKQLTYEVMITSEELNLICRGNEIRSFRGNKVKRCYNQFKKDILEKHLKELDSLPF